MKYERLTADEFKNKIDLNLPPDKIRSAFTDAYFTNNPNNREDLEKLLDEEPYSSIKGLKQDIEDIKQYFAKKQASKSTSFPKLGASEPQTVRRSDSGFLREETLRMQMLSGIITENEYKLKLNEYIEPSFPSEQAWNLWLKLSNENEFDDYNLETFNHLQVGGFLKELQWIEDNKDKYSDEELSQAFSEYLDELY